MSDAASAKPCPPERRGSTPVTAAAEVVPIGPGEGARSIRELGAKGSESRLEVMRWLIVYATLLLTLAACSSSRVERSRASARQFPLEGEVLRLEPKNQVAVIRHEEIQGWMEAMTMEFPVESEAEFRKLRPGDRIRATVFVKDLDYWIGDIMTDTADPR